MRTCVLGSWCTADIDPRRRPCGLSRCRRISRRRSPRSKPDGAIGGPVFASAKGTPLTYANIYNRVLRPALRDAGLAVQIGENAKGEDIWDYQGIAFHALRRACSSILLGLAKKTDSEVQAWLGHSDFAVTRRHYLHALDDRLGGADALDAIIPLRGKGEATEGPQSAANLHRHERCGFRSGSGI